MAATSGRTGRQGSATINSNVINITGWTCKQDVAFADSTDSGNFQSGPNTLPKSQLPGDQQCSGTVKGFYDANTTSTDLDALIKAPASGPYPIVLKIDTSTTYFSGNVDFSDAEMTLEVPGSTMVSFSANWKSNGAYTIN